jgi:hypothetical protein
MVSLDPGAAGLSAPRSGGFVLYLEGPRDRGILQAWAKRLLPTEARRLFDASVILGGRQPARALDHFRRLGGSGAGLRALCVLDRDDGEPSSAAGEDQALEFFTWGRRHIESYLLVAAAIGRALRLPERDRRVERALFEHVPAEGDEAGWRELDAKRLLEPGGPLPRALGVALRPAAIARSMRPAELHADVLDCFARLRAALGHQQPAASVTLARAGKPCRSVGSTSCATPSRS